MLLLFAGVLVAFSSAAPEWERVTSLPNLVEPLRSNHYAGYVQLSPAKELFYWYIESENDPATDPVVLWLNGGPGCSSMQGLFLEMGPLRVNDYGETVTRNPWTWNRYANIIYLDAPAGVGFSVRMDGRWNYTDAEVAADNHQALKMWFQKYPERAGNDFYVAGESYGGTYVPMLSSLLLDDKDFNFKGMLIGNGCVDDVLNYNSVVDFNYNHGFIDERYYRNAIAKCCNNIPEKCDFYGMSLNESSTCYNETNYLGQANLYTGLDPYFVYYTCYLNPHDAPAPSSSDVAAAVLRTHLRRKSPGTRYANAQPACAHHNDSTVYLQRADVRAALNVMNYVPPYETCNDAISQYYDLGATHILSQADNFKKVIKSGKAVALFYGDEDTLCNAVHGAQLVANLGLEEVAPFAPYVDDQQLPPTIGLLTQYQGLDFLTVRGAGHFVASSNEKPKEALQVFVNFLKKTSYNTSVSHDKPYIPPTTTSAASTVTQFVPSDWDAPPWLVTSLPNLDEPLVSKHYTGYLNVSENKKMFYWYVESENDPVNDPVLLWLNGGPGCSSLEGLFVEMGPLRASNSGANISRNEWTWNRVANIIYLDSPAGVGFSAALNGTPIYTDEEVANDNYVALTEWFKKFPDRVENDFYVAGESYAGTYAPMLAVKLIETFQNFKGILVGNGCVDDRLLYNSLVGFNYDHTFIDENSYRMAVQKCCPDDSIYNCDFYQMMQNETDPCFDDAISLTSANVNSGLDPYFLYYTCRLDEPETVANSRSAAMRTHLRKIGMTEAAVTCSSYDDFTNYLNRNDVRRALNIPSVVPKYESCSDEISNTYDLTVTHLISQQQNVKKLVDAQKKVALFYGDVDSICNAVHGAQFASDLGLKLVEPQQIYKDNDQKPPTIGFVTQYEGLDFLTVRGAGHFPAASSEKPKEALQLLVNFLRGTSYSTPIMQLPTTTMSSTPASSTTSASTEVPFTSSTSQMPSTSTKHDKGAYSCSIVQVVVFMVGLLLFK